MALRRNERSITILAAATCLSFSFTSLAQEPVNGKPAGATPPLKNKSTKFIPLPVYATLPNEGSTFGLMPVFIVVDGKSSRTESIYAPSVSWNPVIDKTGTFRWYHYPKETQSLDVIASASTNINWGGTVVWEDEPATPGSKTETFELRVQRSVFYRFFGLGPESSVGNETSNTRIHGGIAYRRGWNVAPFLNIGGRIQIARDIVQPETVPGLASSPTVFPGTSGMSGGNQLTEALDIRYDTRENRDYSLQGHYLDLSFGPSQGLGSSPAYWNFQAEARKLFPEFSWVSGGARFYARYATSPQAPFYYQSALGGSFLMRGYTEDRFIDQGAWTAELEQRFRVFQTHIFDVTTDWRIDPFLAIGQVFHPGSGLASNIRFVEGIGFRAWVRPNVLGRIDVAGGGEGLKTYVELGYPF